MSSPTSSPIPGVRKGDSGLGTPNQVAASAHDVSAEEIAGLGRQAEERERLLAQRAYEELEEAPSGLRMPKALRRTVGTLLLAITGMFGLFAVNEVLALLAKLETLTPAWQVVVIGAMSLFSAMLLWVMLRLLWLYLKLRVNRQVRVKTLEELSRREHLQTRLLAQRKYDEARAQILAILKGYPDTPRAQRALIAAGLTPDQAQVLAAARLRLLDLAARLDARSWIEEYRRQFQDILDAAAQHISERVSLKVGISTALAPNGLLDTAIVLYWSLDLVRRLCILYQVRASRGASLLVLARVFGHAYLAGNLQPFTDSLAAAIAEGVKGSIGELGAKIASGLSARVGEGGVNMFLIRRLGKSCRGLLQPVASA